MHRNARLTVWARQEIVRRRQAGWTLAEIARQLNVSRATASKWWHRFLADPDGDWFEDRSFLQVLQFLPLACMGIFH